MNANRPNPNPNQQDAEQMVSQVLGQLLRQPEPQRDLELERALLRLQAARSDAAYVLLHRVMVLEAALQQLKGAATVNEMAPAPSPGPITPSASPARPATLPSRSFLRDAAVVAAGVTTGVVAGQVLFQGLSDTPEADPTDLAGGDDLLGSFGLL